MRAGQNLERRVSRADGSANVFLIGFRDLGVTTKSSLRRLTAKGRLVRIGYGSMRVRGPPPISDEVVPAKPLPALASEALEHLDVETNFSQAYNRGSTSHVPTGRAIREGKSRRDRLRRTFAVCERASRS